VPLVWAGFVPVTGRADEANDQGQGAPITRTLAFAHGMVGPGLVMATLGAVLDERLGTSGWWSAASLTGAVLAMRFVLESVAAPRLGALSDRWGIRRAATGFFGLGASALVLATVSPVLPVLIAAVVLFFVSGTALGAGLIGDAGKRGSRVLANYVTANDLGAASGPLLGWAALGLFDERRVGLAIGAGLYAVSALAARRYLAAPEASLRA